MPYPTNRLQGIITFAFQCLLVLSLRARREEQEAAEEFGDAYIRYIQKTPAFFPHTGSAD